MSHFRLHTRGEKKKYRNWLLMGMAGILLTAVGIYTVHSFGTARAKSREVVLLYTEEEFEQYLLDAGSEEYNLNGKYRLEEDIDLGWLYQSIGTNVEPFTGSFDGNGHVISGLARPLFGVLREAEIENLYLGDAVIEHPFTYYDGEHYVDGYGALAAYAIHSEIRNCGMNGEIRTASPSEAEYVLEKASPADADEEKGPGVQNPGEIQSGTDGPGAQEAGPGIETETEIGTGTDVSTGADIGTWEETGTGSVAESGNMTETGNGPDKGDISKPAGEETSPSGGESGPAITETTEAVRPPQVSEETSRESETSSPESQPTDAADGESGESGQSGQSGGTEEAGIGEAETEEKNMKSSDTQPADTQPAQPAAPDTKQEQPDSTNAETVGYHQVDRQLLAMKTSVLVDMNIGGPSDATPSDATEVHDQGSFGPADPSSDGNGTSIATPSDASATDAENENHTESQPDEETQYIGNPNGDIIILVTADRVTAGGLVAQTEGETLISDSFALITIGSFLEETETYTGGLCGILGEGTRTENSYVSGLSDSDGVNGGFAAVNDGLIENCYSTVTIGETGNTSGAFTRLGNGVLTGCVYDRQMACIEESEMAAPSDASEFHLIGLDTSDMTGTESAVPGNWRKTEHAYPQLEYFAQSDHETVMSNSKLSVVALELPDGQTLSEVLNTGGIQLPMEVDGQEIQWEGEGGIEIEEGNQIRFPENVSFTPNDVPVVGTSLEPEPATDITEAADDTNESVNANESSNSKNTIRLNASVGVGSRSYALTVAEDETPPADWQEVGSKITTPPPTANPSEPPGTETNPYLLDSAEDLAWFAYAVNSGKPEICATMTTDIDLFGGTYTKEVYKPDYLANSLKWITIDNYYSGTFDGGNHKITSLCLKGNRSKGFFGAIRGGTVKNVGIESGYINFNKYRTGAAVVAVMYGGKVLNCWNKVDITNGDGEVGGVVGFVSGVSAFDNWIEGCFNTGNVSAATNGDCGVGGILGICWAVPNTINLTVRNCYNTGIITATNNLAAGGIVGRVWEGATTVTIENCYDVGEVRCTDGNAIMGIGPLDTVVNCYYDSETSGKADGQAEGYTTAQMQSWAAAYALNGQQMEGAWTYIPGEYPKFGELPRPDDWSVVGQGVLDGLVKNISPPEGEGSMDTPCQIGSAEQLGAFAARVNAGNPALHANLLMDINLTGVRYHGTEDSPIPWKPIGTSSQVYSGTFNGNGKAIGYMNVVQDGYAGLFGCAGGGAVIKGLGLYSSCSVTAAGTAGGDGAAAFVAAVKSDGTTETQITIQNCYNRGSIAGKTGMTGAFIGNYEDTAGAGTQKIANCYTTGLITTASGTPGAIAGAFTNGSGGGIKYCYWNKETCVPAGKPALNAVGSGTSAAVEESRGMTTAEMNTATADASGGLLAKLNTNLGTGTWQRSAVRNDGYPVFIAGDIGVTWADVGAAVMAPLYRNLSSPATAGEAENPYLIWTAEDLAWFSYQVNHGNAGLCVELKSDINLYGGLYTGFTYDPGASDTVSKALPWIPVGLDEDGKRYTGTFNGNGHTISIMLAKNSEKLGLFGTLGADASVTNTTLSNSRLDASGLGGSAESYLGGIAGYVNGANASIRFCKTGGTLEGSGTYFGGIAGGAGNAAGLVIEGCYHGENVSVTADTGAGSTVGGILGKGSSTADITVRNCYNRGSVHGGSFAGGIAGEAVTDKTTIAGCYNAGPVTAESGGQAGSIAGAGDVDGALIRDCLIEDSHDYGSASGVVIKQEIFKTWGAAFRLNGESLQQSGGWTWEKADETAGDGYPKLTNASLNPAESWEPVGEALDAGLLKDKSKPSGNGNANPYEITNPEQLAWFAYQVNRAGKPGMNAVLAGDIDMKSTENRYISDGRLGWIPIGTDGAAAYTGTFGSKNLSDAADTRKIYRIQNLYVNITGTAGLFGTVAGGNISRIGLTNAEITGANAGGIAGNTSGAAMIAQCYNRSENTGSVSGSGSGSVTASNNAGGIVGQTASGVTVRDCYNLETTITGAGSASYAGGIVGNGNAGTIRNSYSACGSAGSITASGSGTAGAVNGNPGTGSGMSQCYSDTGWTGGSVSLADSSFVSRLYSTGNAQLKEQTAGLNTAGGRINILADRLWYTSLSAEATKGYPTLEPPVMITTDEVTPADGADGANGVTVSFGALGSIPDAKFRYAAQESVSDTPLVLTAWKTEFYHSCGTTSANEKAGLAGVAGSTDTILDPVKMSLENPSQSLGTISSLKLYTGAAYTYPADRDMLVELSSNTTRYEIRFTIKGVTGKSLVVDLPANVAMEELLPGGAEDTAFSVSDVVMKNSHAYPMEARILKVTPISEDDRISYRALKPIARNDSYAGGQIYDSGIKLGITNPKTGTGVIGEDLYYNPDAAGDTNPWMKCQLKAGGTLLYRYFLKYQADPYYDSEHPNFGFTVSYQFGIMAEDYSASADAVAWQ